ncbi:MAG: DUF58 domain-containing protein [Polyangiaceae bacterium]|nr:DUF58 domain-containing protein [Polyangiaceae bacterium]MCW5791282.1 DUF58 domain-containing protein [Polyangiaceae bacterium]
MKLARLNHILIPATKEGRDKARRSWLVRLARPFTWFGSVTTREGRGLSLLIAFMALSGADVRSTRVYWLWVPLFAVLMVSLAARRWFKLTGVTLSAEAPPTVTEGEPLELRLTLVNHGREARHAIRIAGPFLPWDGAWLRHAPGVAVLPAGGRTTRSATARFIERGDHHLDVFQATQLVPFRLTHGPRVVSEGCRFCVVPRPARVDLNALLDRLGTDGAHRDAQTRAGRGGRGDIIGVRAYRAGDPIRDLHMRTWARTGEPHVREYQAAESGRSVVVLDAAGERDEPAFEASIRFAAGVLSALVERGHTVDLILSSAEHTTHGVNKHPDSLALGLAALARTRPQLQPPAELWSRVERELGDDTLALVMISPSPARAAELDEALRRGHPRGLCVAVTRREGDSARIREVLVSELEHGEVQL